MNCSTTFIGAQIIQNELIVHQRGDSILLLLNIDYHQGKNFYNLRYKTVEEVHSFNFPKQYNSINFEYDDPTFYKYDVNKNDIIILGSDGVFDNIPH